jgi:hypothetical protein
MKAITSTFKSGEPALPDLLREIHRGEIQLPDFQRGWVWDDDHIRSLIASVSLSYPIGAVMLLQTGGDGAQFQPRPVQGVTVDGEVKPELLILDGQQRMTSLYLALASGQPVPTKTTKNQEIDRLYYLDIIKCLDPVEDRFDAVLSIPPDRKVTSDFGRKIELDVSASEKEYELTLFPLEALLEHAKYAAWRRGFQKHHRANEAKLDQFDKFEAEVINRIQSYRVPTIELLRDTPREAVCQVFEKVNTGGVTLTVFELVTAIFASDGFNLRYDWDARSQRLGEHEVLKEVDATTYLTAITLLATYRRNQENLETPVRCTRKDVLKLSLADYRRHADQIEAGLKLAARFLAREKVFDTRMLPYTTQLIPLSAICTVLEDRFEQDTVRRKLAPARTRCLCCGGTAGSRSVITPVGLGTSAAVKVLGEGLVESLTEANRNRPGHDGKERLLIFSDSRQDAAHQARFIIFSSRYDRMRRRLLSLLDQHKELTIQKAVELLGDLAVESKDNPHVPEDADWISDEARSRIQAYEEAPLLDEISVNAGYRATVVNLGLVGINYHRLDEYARARGATIAQNLGIGIEELEHLCRVLLDAIRTRGALSRPMLQYHPSHIACPQFIKLAEWERQLRSPQGYPLTPGGEIVVNLDTATLPYGIKHHNAWRRHGVGGRAPSLEGLFRNLINRFGGNPPDDQSMIGVLDFLKRGSFLTPVDLYGARDRRVLLQVNADIVRLVLLTESTRLQCEVCGEICSGTRRTMPCPRCHGMLVRWPDAEIAQNRTVKHIRKKDAIPLVAKEHTAQVTPGERAEIEDKFKGRREVSPVNLLSCSPTLEMGIDVGGLDAIILRNVPPRPDNYAQRGGRAGRRSRVGMVVGYARNTPHDQYFYDKPREMIAGEVPAPSLTLGNRDVIVRHLYAIVFGAANPGLSGKMVDYVAPNGTLNEEAITALIEAVKAQTDHAIQLAGEAWGAEVFTKSQLAADELRKHLENLPDRVRRVFETTARQVIELRTALDRYAQDLQGRYAGLRAGDLVARLLGIPSDQRRQNQEADDRSAGYPLRRFAEFGLLPGYEFPSEPASLRLLGDPHEEDPISVTRRFGIGQFQPDAHVYARSRRWKVIGLDTSSPWNPQAETPTWNYRLCGTCGLRYDADQPRCPRCQVAGPGVAHPGYDFAGFLARREERPILDEEDRFAVRNLVRVYPQWDGSVTGRWTAGPGWALRLSRNEEVRWLNEGLPPSPNDVQAGNILLHLQAKGYLLCPSCGNLLDQPAPVQAARGGRRNAQRQPAQAANGHSNTCPHRGNNPVALGITTSGNVEVLRLLLPVPHATQPDQVNSWGLSLGYALLNGIQHHFMLGSGELDFEIEGPWNTGDAPGRYGMVSLAFIDPSLGGSGYLERVAENLHLVAARAIDHLDHRDCETACYRCLKSYYNQRYHDLLAWPQTLPALEELRHQPPRRRPLETGDIDDPRPWLEAYAAGVGSPLELKFLRLFEQHGFHPEKQVPVSPTDGGAPISVADFAVPMRRVAIYVDGAAFHTGVNLRRDRNIRNRLREGSPPWKIVELRAVDLQRGADLIREISQL